jgi:hypothetical protein
MSVSIEIDISKLESFLENYSKEVRVKVRDELRTTGFEVETTYKIGVPLKTARLKSSIHTEHSDFRRFTYSDNQGNTFDGSFKEKAKDDLTVFVGTNVQYAGVIERGFNGVVNVKSFTRTRKGRVETVSAHTRNINRQGNNALANAFELHTSGLKGRINKILKP